MLTNRFTGLALRAAALVVLTAANSIAALGDSRLRSVAAETSFASPPDTEDAVSAVRRNSLEDALEETKFRPLPIGIGGRDTEFGSAVSISGNRALVGGVKLAGVGAVLVYEYSEGAWVETATLRASDGSGFDDFGGAVSLSGDRALIGASGDDSSARDSGAAYVFDFDGSNWTETAKLTADVGGTDDAFGFSVSLLGNRALIGEPFDDDLGIYSGSAYVFEFDGSIWNQAAKLNALDGAREDRFGLAVCLSNDRALIGAPTDDDNGDSSGSVYVFEFDGSTWSETAKLISSNGADGDRFGAAIDLSANRALIGSPLHENNGSRTGAAHMFEFDGANWNETGRLIAMDGGADDLFGASVDLFGDSALIGAERFDDGSPDSGAAFFFHFDGTSWNESGKLTPSDAEAGDRLGGSVGLSGERALIGAAFSDADGTDSGAAYVFDFNGANWSEVRKFTAGTSAAKDRFGESVDSSRTRVLVGAPGEDDDTGAVHVFEFDGMTWSSTASLIASDGSIREEFGASVALSGNRALVGAPFDDDLGDRSGSAYVFEFDGSNWLETAKLTASNGFAEDRFGSAVSLVGNRALVGASDASGRRGSAYIFELSDSSWIETEYLTPSDGEAFDQFGIAVALSEDRALVGSPGNNGNARSDGAAYVFDFVGASWNETAKLAATDATDGDRFGSSLSLSGDRVLIGASRKYVTGTRSGAAYVFDFDGINWTETAKLAGSGSGTFDEFGWSASLSGDRAVVGTRREDGVVPDTGSAYVFDFDGSGWIESARLASIDGESGDQFGKSVSLSGERLTVGAVFDDDSGFNSGSAYIFNLPVFVDGFESP